MPHRILALPFFDDAHREMGRALAAWIGREVAPLAGDAHGDIDELTRTLVRLLGGAGWLRLLVPAAHGGSRDRVDVRSICLARESLARASGLADFAFAMQGLGGAPIAEFGSEALREELLPAIAAGRRIAAFALSESEAGSDVAAMRTTARRDGDGWVIDGEKTWISNAGIADQYVLIARAPELAERAFLACVVEASSPGLRVSRRIDVIAPHPLGTVTLEGCRVPNARVLGEPGAGLHVALGTLDIFRASVGAAALGFARRAMDEALAWVRERQVFGRPLGEHQLTRAALADMAVRIDASALMIYRAAWLRDGGAEPVTVEASMAKLFATEEAQRVIDQAVQLLGARGVEAGAPVEQLYREIRALRIYEGTSEIQRLIIGKHLVSERAGPA